jgi:hypothetical protein
LENDFVNHVVNTFPAGLISFYKPIMYIPDKKTTKEERMEKLK